MGSPGSIGYASDFDGDSNVADDCGTIASTGAIAPNPIAIIRWASQPQEHIWIGTLESIVQQTSRQSLSPAVIVIGEVVNLRTYLQPTPD